MAKINVNYIVNGNSNKNITSGKGADKPFIQYAVSSLLNGAAFGFVQTVRPHHIG